MTTSTLATLTTWLLLATTNAHPHHQLFYTHAVPEQQAASFIYVPQADAASVASIQQYSAPVALAPPATQYVLFYPGSPQDNFLPRADEAKPPVENPPTIWNLFNVFQRPTTTPAPAPAPEEKPAENTPTTTVATRVEETTPKPAEDTPVKPEKIVSDNDEIMIAVEQVGGASVNEQKASLENLDEFASQNPQVGDPAPRQYIPVQRPQFFGNYDFLKQGDMQQRFGIPPGAVSNFHLYRNGFAQPEAVPAAIPQSGRPLKLQDQEVYQPGVAALTFQRDLQTSRLEQQGNRDETVAVAQPDASNLGADQSQYFGQRVQPQFLLPSPASSEFVTSQVGGQGLVTLRQTLLPNQQVFPAYPSGELPGVVNVGPGYQNVYFISPRLGDGGQGVVVDADSPKKGDKEDSEGVEAEQAGPSVAQAKPQAIALAGAGGVAAAAPVATAVVGAGGLAVAAPTATAVAGGPSGGGTLVGPAHAAVAAVNKHLTREKNNKTKQDDFQRDRARYDVR